jgi:hypothetical protein
MHALLSKWEARAGWSEVRTGSNKTMLPQPASQVVALPVKLCTYISGRGCNKTIAGC